MRKWTDSDIETLRKLWRTPASTAEIARHLGRSPMATSVKANKLGLRPKPVCNIIRLTAEQEIWLRRNYPHMRTIICAQHLGVSPRSCVRLARRLGVEKTAEFMRQTQAVTARKARESHLRNGTYPPKGVVNANLEKGAAFRFKPKNL